MLDGMVALAILIIFIVAGHKTYSNQVLQIIFYLVLAGYALLHLTKFKTCKLILKEDEFEFHDGMLTVKKLPYNQIKKIEYNPEALIRVYLIDKGENYTRILNVFSKEETEEIFSFIQSKNRKVVIDYIDRNSTNK